MNVNFKKLGFMGILLGLSSMAMAKSYIVYDFKDNKMLEGEQVHEVRPIASVTKLMTANVFLNHNQNPNCVNTITDADIDRLKGTKTRLPFHTPISCADLLKAMLVSSDNYAASALSRSTNLTRAQFIQAMNDTAKAWGMKNTRFHDSSGLSPKNVSTVADLTILAYHSMMRPEIIKLSNTSNTNVQAYAPNGISQVSFRNTNKLVREGLASALISKTGYIRESGYNLVMVNGTPCANSMTIGVISLNNNNSVSRAEFTKDKLMSYGCYVKTPYNQQYAKYYGDSQFGSDADDEIVYEFGED